MKLESQTNILENLSQLADADRHSILIEGPAGCGKTYLSKQFASMLHITDFYSIQPTVQSIRDTIEASLQIHTPVVFCIENLDVGVPAASYTLLKFLEEPMSHVYIVVTCRNQYRVPDTILSRSACLSASIPTVSDINYFAELTDSAKYTRLATAPIWRSVKTLQDVVNLYKLSKDQLDYLEQLPTILSSKDCVSNIVWKLGHYEDNTEIDLSLAMNYLISSINSTRVRKYIIQCMQDISSSRIASHAVLSKFVFEYKYGD